MAVGVDYALFFVVRSRAERSRGVAIGEALETTLRTSGRTVIVSGATVAIAMAGMYLVGVRTLSGIATAAIAVIACAVLGAVTVLPATLRLLGPRIDRGRIRLLPRARTDGSRFWSSLVDQRSPPTAHRRRARNSAPRCTRVPRAGASHLPAERSRADRSGRAGAEGARRCPPSLPQRRRDRRRRRRGAGSREGATPAQQLHRLSRLAVREGFANQPVDSIRTVSTSAGSAAALFLPLTGNGANRSSRHAVEQLRQRLIPATLGRVAGAKTAVTGPTAEDIDFTRRIGNALPYVLAFVLALAFGLLLVAFRSIVVPLKAIALNLLSVAASYGVLALVFQHRWAEQILGFQSNGTIVSWLPLFLFVVLFGLSMDYHVFILSRVREAVDGGEPTETAVRRTHCAHRRRRHRRGRCDGLRLRSLRDALVTRAQAGRCRPGRSRPDRRDRDPRRAPAGDDDASRRSELVPAAQPQLAAQARARAARDAGASSAVARLDPLTGPGTAAHIQRPRTKEIEQPCTRNPPLRRQPGAGRRKSCSWPRSCLE